MMARRKIMVAESLKLCCRQRAIGRMARARVSEIRLGSVVSMVGKSVIVIELYQIFLLINIFCALSCSCWPVGCVGGLLMLFAHML